METTEFSEQVKLPSKIQFEDDEFRRNVGALFRRRPSEEQIALRKTLIDNVAILGTKEELNDVFAGLRLQGKHAFFTPHEANYLCNHVSGIDYCYVSDGDENILTWKIHNVEDEDDEDDEFSAKDRGGWYELVKYSYNKYANQWCPIKKPALIEKKTSY